LVSGEHVKISVTDTGSGIAGEVRERIFEPFFSTKSPGRGMGLAAALGIVRSHRGWLDIQSAVGVGTICCVYWPGAHRTKEQLPSSVAPAAGSLREGCVLLIDDEPAVRVVTAKLLAELGQRVLVAESGRVGIELFEKHGTSIDLVLLDLTMPEQSGSEVLAELRRLRNDVRVVVTSGYHLSDATTLLSTPNVVGFLEKPHTLARLEIILASVPARGDPV
jgi:CheY-like chemotaxis protein